MSSTTKREVILLLQQFWLHIERHKIHYQVLSCSPFLFSFTPIPQVRDNFWRYLCSFSFTDVYRKMIPNRYPFDILAPSFCPFSPHIGFALSFSLWENWMLTFQHFFLFFYKKQKILWENSCFWLLCPQKLHGKDR